MHIHCPLCGVAVREDSRCRHVRFLVSGVEPANPVYASDVVLDHIAQKLEEVVDDRVDMFRLLGQVPDDVALFSIALGYGGASSLAMESRIFAGFSLASEELDLE